MAEGRKAQSLLRKGLRMKKYIVRLSLTDGSVTDILVTAKNEFERNKIALQTKGALFIMDAKEVS